MEKNFYIESKKMENNIEEYNLTNNTYSFSPTNDIIVNEFLNKNISLETLIENQIFK